MFILVLATLVGSAYAEDLPLAEVVDLEKLKKPEPVKEKRPVLYILDGKPVYEDKTKCVT
jgi:hypothetical protein